MVLSMQQIQDLDNALTTARRFYTATLGRWGGDHREQTVLNNLVTYLTAILRDPGFNYESHSYNVMEVRRSLSSLIWFANEEQAQFCHELQILWARYFPLNTRNGLGELVDPLSSETVTDPVETSAGYIMDASSLNRYYERADAYMVHGDEILPCDFRVGMDLQNAAIPLNKYERIHLLNNGITLLHPDAALLDADRGFSFDKINLVEDVQVTEKKLSRLTIASNAKTWFENLGTVLGDLAYVGLLITSVIFLAPPMAPMIYGTWIGVSLFAGLLCAIDSNDNIFGSIAKVFASNWIAIALTSLLAPQVVMTLASYSLISGATAAAFVAAMPITLTCIPVAFLVLGALGGMFLDDINVFRSFHQGTSTVAHWAFYYAAGAVGALFGCVLGIAKNCFRSAIQPATEATLTEYEERPEVGVVDEPAGVPVANSMGIANALRIDPNAMAHAVADPLAIPPSSAVLSLVRQNANQIVVEDEVVSQAFILRPVV